MLGPVTAQVIHVGVDIAQRDRPGQVQIHVVNRNFIQLGGTWCFAFFDFHIAEEVAQIQVVFIHRFSGVTLNGLMIHQKVPQNRRSSQTVVICIQILPPTQQNFYFVELEIYPPLEELPPVYHACGGWSSWPFAALGLLELGVEKLVGHGIDKGGFDRAVVECALDALDVAVALQEFDGVDLAEAVRRDVLREPERPGGALHVGPDGLPGLVGARALARKRPFGPGLGPDGGQERGREAHPPALLRLGFCDHHLEPNILCPKGYDIPHP